VVKRTIKLVETPVFHSLINQYLSPLEYWDMQETLASNPGKGSVIPGAHGMRKVRWSIAGKGKSGGLRIIYLWEPDASQPAIYFVFVYRKSTQGDLTPRQMQRLISELEA